MKKFLLNIWYTILYQFEQHRVEISAWWYDTQSFESLPANLQRIRVAKDVIAQVRLEKYKANRGAYISQLRTNNNVENQDDVKKNFDKIKSCEVCALGACLLSTVKFKNTLQFQVLRQADEDGDFGYNKQIQNLLSSLFSPVQLLLIEMAFEKSTSIGFFAEKVDNTGSLYDIDWRIKDDAVTFGYKYNSHHDRLIAIMENIIDNNGTFKP